jgi:regulator of protease activity HflC (stomatin/prohibitin superfamily)
MSWLEILAQYIRHLWPLWIVKSFEQGVRFRFGRDIELLSPGVYFAWWWFEEIVTTAVVPCVINLPSQSICTSDRVGVTFSANIEYTIFDARAYYCRVTDFDHSLRNAAMGHLARKIRDWSLEELATHQNELERSLERTLTTYIKEWGVTIRDVRLTDLVPTKGYRFFADAGV